MASNNVDKVAAFVAQLKACAKRKDLYTGSQIHADIVESRLLESNIFLGSALINMYAKCGALAKARHVFDEIPERNVFCWTALITGYANHGLHEEALAYFHKMKCGGPSPDAVTFACILKACAGLRSVQTGQSVHADIVRDGLIRTNVNLGNGLVDMYAKCGVLTKAQQLFNELEEKDIVCWNALITGFCLHGQNEKCLNCFEQLKSIGLFPNSVTYFSVLKACGNTQDLEKGREVHEELVSKGLLRNDRLLCTALIDMYAKCGVLDKAREVFDELPARDLVSWNTLIKSYSQHGFNEEVFKCYEKMKQDDIFPDAITNSCILKACGSIKAILFGERIHEEIQRKGLLRDDNVLGTSLMDMYIKCGVLTKAQKVFDEILKKDIVSWNALIAGYCQNGHIEEAFACFERMKSKGFCPNAMTFSSLVKVCGSMGATERGKEVHSEIIRNGLQGKASEFGSLLVDMYAKCGALVKAQEIFDRLIIKDVVSWTALIANYTEHGHGEDAITCFERMLEEGPSPDAITFACVLRACQNLGAVEKGEKYFDMMTTWFDFVPLTEHYVHMVNLLGGAGQFEKTLAVINKMPSLDVFQVWYALLVTCQKWVNIKIGEFAFDNARRLDDKSAAVYACMSKLYAAGGMYESADKMLVKAKEVFDGLSVRDAVSWNALISGYCQRGLGKEAIDCFDQLKREGIQPNALTFLSTLKTCGNMGAADKGKEIHEEIVSNGLLEKDGILGTALVDMYAKCGALAKARELFDKLSDRNEVSWNSLIACYCEHGLYEEALNLFDLMQCEGLFPDSVTMISILKACGNLRALSKGQQIHDMILFRRLLQNDYGLGSALVDMYSQCGVIGKAQEVLDGLVFRDVNSWNALISGYCEHGHSDEAYAGYTRMEQEGIAPNEKTFTSILKACGNTGAIEKGREVHAEIAREGRLEDFSVLGSALVDMYAKCGALVKAHEVSDTLKVRDVFSWTALMTGYCNHGLCEKALSCFEQMNLEGAAPDAVSFTCILKVCSSVGAVEKGRMYYESMSGKYGISPSIQHNIYALNLLGYAGHVDTMMGLMKKMPSFDLRPAWFSLLSSCQRVGNIEHGHLAFKHAISVNQRTVLA